MGLLAHLRGFLVQRKPLADKEELDREVARLNGAIEGLTNEVSKITSREQSRQEFAKMLDDALRALNGKQSR